ncbi:MAG: restriction endonuclease subunit S [Acidobacteria bacterium]|nr:restriction endonuclease subunit S [Acidobacteriota bacterium]
MPIGWISTTIKELFELKYGKGLVQEQRNSNGKISVYGSNGIIGKHNQALTKGSTIIIGRKGSVGEINFSQESCWPIDTTYYIDEYLVDLPVKYWLFYLKSLQLGQQDKSSAIPGINRENIYSIKIPLPPLNEQRRIVAKLEVLLGKVDGCQKRLEKIPRILKRFRQSVLAAACDGRLTADWREGNKDVEPAINLLNYLKKKHEKAGGHKRGNAALPTEDVHTLTKESLPETWELTELKELCEPNKPITYGILKPGLDTPQGIPYIRVADFPEDKINLSNLKRTSIEIDSQYLRSKLKEGDILLSIRGTVGRVCIVPTELNNANITQDSARLSIQKEVESKYIFYVLKAIQTQLRMQKAIKGVAIRGINIGDVRVLQIPLPPLAEQQEIVRRVESLFKLADQLEGRYQKAKSYVDKLTQSILAKAFRGELVAQDPNDEPASVLLERIKQEKEAATTEKTRKVSVKSKVANKKESKEIIVENKAHINDKFVEIVKENKSSNFNKMVADIEKLGEQMTLPFIGED